MYKTLVIIMIIMWVVLIGIAAMNMYNQYLVSQQSVKIIRIYQLKSTVNPIFKNVHDSLNREIAVAESLSNALIKPFPIKDIKKNWLMLRLAMLALSIVSIAVLGLHYRKEFQR